MGQVILYMYPQILVDKTPPVVLKCIKDSPASNSSLGTIVEYEKFKHCMCNMSKINSIGMVWVSIGSKLY